ncbi:MAG: diguanylate cyclase [Pseudomonadota bacterium]|nr:diguanylate cyclase [Pseudomonadota bacterium]
MTLPATPESTRLTALCSLNLLDTPPEARFDRFTLLATAAFGVPIALVSLVDADRQWFKSRQGLDATETPRPLAFCNYAIASEETFIVPDTALDPRFADSPLVLGAPFIRFYAGHPIRTIDGHAAGTLCVMDTRPRAFTPPEQAMLVSLAKLVEDEMNRNSLIDARMRAEIALHQLNLDLEQRVVERTQAIAIRNSELQREIERRAAVEATLRQSEQRIRTITENLPTLIAQVDRNGIFTFVNSRTAKFYGGTAEELLHKPIRAAYSERDYARVAPHVELARSGQRASFESEILIDGKTFWYHASFVPQLTADGQPDGFFAMAFDITARRETEIAQVRSEERLKTITDNLPVLISYIDTDMRYRFANAMYQDWLGVAPADMLGRTIEEAFGATYSDERLPFLRRAMAGEMCTTEYTVTRKRHQRILSTTYIPHSRDGRIVGAYVLGTDTTAAREHERQLLTLANSDPLTGLPNRRMYEFQLDKALANARRQRSQLALVYLDLDNFKKINDTLGHAVGDEVLIEFGKRVKSALRETDMLARLAGDEFTIILESSGGYEGGERVAHTILRALAEPFMTDKQRLQISASIGIALGGPRSSAISLASSADAALYAAKRAGKNRYVLQACASEAPFSQRDAFHFNDTAQPH